MKKTILNLIVLTGFIGVCNGQIWTPVGADINGESTGDKSGSSVSLNTDGTIMAIGAIENDGGGTDAGHVRIYQNTAGSWVQIGQDIDGEAAGDKFGSSLSLSDDGSIVAIGARYNDGNGGFDNGHVRIYQNISGTWTQIGQDIDGENGLDQFGNSVELSADGQIVAIGGFFNDDNGGNAGHVRIYQNVSGTWTQIGQDIDGEASGDEFGTSLSLSADGSIVAIGAPFNDGSGGFNNGHARIYENISGIWTQIGQDIEGEASNDELGTSISLSNDGSIVAIGATGNDGTGLDVGHVRIYQNSSGTWTQTGQDIDGEADENKSGHSISLSADGSVIAIGAIFNYDNGIETGHVRIYENVGGSWAKVGQDIDGEAMNDQSGNAISLSSDGLNVAIGAHLNDGNGNNSGHVRVYKLLNTPSITSQPSNQSNICPNNGISFSIVANNADTYQWQENSGSGFVDITNGGIYSNTTSATLNITNVSVGMNGYQYRCIASNNDGDAISNSATLSTDIESPVIPNLTTLTGECSVTATTPSATDNCTGIVTGTTTDPTEFTDQGTYTITWTFADGNGNSTSANQTVIVEDITDPEITCLGNQNVTPQDSNGYTVQGLEFDPTSTSDNCEIAFVENDFNNTSTLENEILPEGTTTINWTVTDVAGNTNSCSFDVTVNASTFVGIETLQQKGISIYPNPNKGQFTMQFDAEVSRLVTIVDVTGKTVYSEITNSQLSNVDLDLHSGVYFIEVTTDDSSQLIKMIVK